MTKMLNLNVRVGGALQEFVVANTGANGDFDNASEYVRHLIRQDKSKAERSAFEAKRAALQTAFAQPEDQYDELSLEEFLARAHQGT